VTDTDWVEQVAEARDAGATWLLISPIKVERLEAGPYLIDVEVMHRLRSDTVEHEDAAPIVHAVTGLVRADGESLGREPVTLDLGTVAVDAVIASIKAGFLWVDVGGGDYRAGPRAWPAISAVVASAVGRHRRFRWTVTRRQFLLDHWPEHNASELGAALGVPPSRVRAQLDQLRKQYGNDRVPLGQTGRPRREDT
jgi:hypothetical protein